MCLHEILQFFSYRIVRFEKKTAIFAIEGWLTLTDSI